MEQFLINLFQKKPEKAYLTDFGFARKMNSNFERSSTFCGSTAYVSPEILENFPYLPLKSDCWSMGVILYIMLCAFMPYDTQNVRKMISQQKQSVEFYHMKGKLARTVEALIWFVRRNNVFPSVKILWPFRLKFRNIPL